MHIVLGIPNCDTIKKTQKFLKEHQVPFQFRDVRKDPLSEEEWAALVDQDKDEKLVNTRSPSFRATGLKAKDLDRAKRIELLHANPTLMKRPTLIKDRQLLIIGFDQASFTELAQPS